MSSRLAGRLRSMVTFALIHGSGDGGWAWHLVQQALGRRGHDVVAPDLPTDRDDATWEDCVAAIAPAVAGAEDLVVVGHSSGGFVVPLAADRYDAVLQVFLAGMVPQPGETASEWFGNVGWQHAVRELSGSDQGEDPEAVFYHDVPRELASEAASRERGTSERLAEIPWPSASLPDIAARYVVTTRDRFLPPVVQRRVAAARLGITAPDEIEAGHCANLSRPEDVATLLVAFADLATSMPPDSSALISCSGCRRSRCRRDVRFCRCVVASRQPSCDCSFSTLSQDAARRP